MNYIPGMGPLSKATSSDKSPVPGHLLRDIARASRPTVCRAAPARHLASHAPRPAEMTHESLEQCDKVEHYLTKRLSNKNPQVLAKTLRVIKVCAGPSPAAGRGPPHHAPLALIARMAAAVRRHPGPIRVQARFPARRGQHQGPAPCVGLPPAASPPQWTS